MILHAVSNVFEDFRYEREIGAPDARDHAFVFAARAGDREIQRLRLHPCRAPTASSTTSLSWSVR